MKKYNSKLIIIRGNSGSGKSTIAKSIRNASQNPRGIAIVEQDYLRRAVLMEKDVENGNNIDLIYQTVVYALSRDYQVILEGILTFSRYGEMLKRLISRCPDHHIYYLDVSLEETLKRHQTKPNCHEFGEEKMRAWYKANDFTNFEGERIIPETKTLDETVGQIMNESGLDLNE